MRRTGVKHTAYALSNAVARENLAAGNPKFHAGETPLEQEAALKVIEPTNEQQLKELMKMIDLMYEEAGPQQRKALDFYKGQMAVDGATNAVKMRFLRRFYFWLLGRGTNDDHAKTLWGRGNVAVYNPEVAAYIEQFVEKRLQYALQLSLLAQRIPVSLNGFYLYFKYIVNGELKRAKGADNIEFWDLSNDDFLKDFEVLAQYFDNKVNYADLIKPAATRPNNAAPFGAKGTPFVGVRGSTEPYPAGHENDGESAAAPDRENDAHLPNDKNFLGKAASGIAKTYGFDGSDRRQPPPETPAVAPKGKEEVQQPVPMEVDDESPAENGFGDRFDTIERLLREQDRQPLSREHMAPAVAATTATRTEIDDLRSQYQNELRQARKDADDEREGAAKERLESVKRQEQQLNDYSARLRQQHEAHAQEQRNTASAIHNLINHVQTPNVNVQSDPQMAAAVKQACEKLHEFMNNKKHDHDGAAAVAASGVTVDPQLVSTLKEQNATQAKMIEELRNQRIQNANTAQIKQEHAKDAIKQTVQDPELLSRIAKLESEAQKTAALSTAAENARKKQYDEDLANVNAQVAQQQQQHRAEIQQREQAAREESKKQLSAETAENAKLRQYLLDLEHQSSAKLAAQEQITRQAIAHATALASQAAQREHEAQVAKNAAEAAQKLDINSAKWVAEKQENERIAESKQREADKAARTATKEMARERHEEAADIDEKRAKAKTETEDLEEAFNEWQIYMDVDNDEAQRQRDEKDAEFNRVEAGELAAVAAGADLEEERKAERARVRELKAANPVSAPPQETVVQDMEQEALIGEAVAQAEEQRAQKPPKMTLTPSDEIHKKRIEAKVKSLCKSKTPPTKTTIKKTLRSYKRVQKRLAAKTKTFDTQQLVSNLIQNRDSMYA